MKYIVENTVGKGRNTGDNGNLCDQHFLIFLNIFFTVKDKYLSWRNSKFFVRKFIQFGWVNNSINVGKSFYFTLCKFLVGFSKENMFQF